jgi:hypothetical protein
MAVMLSVYAPAALTAQKYLLVLIYDGFVNTITIVRQKGLSKLKKCNDLIGTRTSEIPACSISASTIFATACPRDFKTCQI